MHSWSWQSCSGNVWFTDPLLTYRFDLPFAFQRAGILTVQGLLRCNSACLTTLENHSKYAASWLTDTLNVCDRQYINLSQKSWFLTTRAVDPHLLTPFVTKNFASLVSLKCYSTLQFYGNNNILAVMLQAECQAIYLKLLHTHDPKDRIFMFQTSELSLWVQNEIVSKRRDPNIVSDFTVFDFRVQLAIINVFGLLEEGEPGCEHNIDILQPFNDMICRIYVISDD